MNYTQVDDILTAIEAHFDGDTKSHYITNNLNPILISTLLMSFLEKFNERYNVVEFRVAQLKEILEEQCRAVFVHLYMPNEIRAQVK